MVGGNSQMVMTTMSCVSSVLWEPLLLELDDVSGPSMAQYRSQPVAGQLDTASWLLEQVMLPMPLAGQSVRLASRDVGTENPLQPAGSVYPAAWHSGCLSFSSGDHLQPTVTGLALSEHGAFALDSGRHDLRRVNRPASCAGQNIMPWSAAHGNRTVCPAMQHMQFGASS